MADVSFIRGTTSGISETPLVDGQLLVDTDKKDILLDVEDSSTHDVERLSMNSIPAGGAAGQVLKKASAADRDVTWGNAASGGGHTIVDGSGNDMADEDDLQFTGGLTVTDDDTNGRTVVSAAGKMNTDGSNAANHVTFGGAFTVGSRGDGTVGTNSVAEGHDTVAEGDYTHAEGYMAKVAVSSFVDWDIDTSLPKDFNKGSAVVYNNKIHILGGYNNKKMHYSYDGSSWTQEASLSNNFYQGAAVVYNNKIHVLGGNNGLDSGLKQHYSFDGSEWTQEALLPSSVMNCSAVVYDDNIYLFSGYYCYIYDGTSWTVDETSLPYDFIDGSAVVYEGEIHIFGSSNSSDSSKHYVYDGNTWTQATSIPYYFMRADAVVYNGEIHIQGSGFTDYTKNHYSYDNLNGWHKEFPLKNGFYYGSTVVYNGVIHVLGGSGSSRQNKYSPVSRSAKGSHAEGEFSLTLYESAHAEGRSTSAIAECAHAEGKESVASGIYSHSEGENTVASGRSAHAEGAYTTASSTYSHAEGYYATASGMYSHAEGGSTTASANYTHAEGSNTTASHTYSHAEGIQTKTGRTYQHVQGKYNVGRDDTLFEIGNGTTDGSGRKNIFEVYEDGSLTVGSRGTGTVGEKSVAMGDGCVAAGDYSSAEGVYSKTLINNYIHTNITEESILPYSFYDGSAVVYNDKIYILGGYGYSSRHYSYDGTSWTRSTLPYNFYRGSAVVFNNKIHMLGSYNSDYYTSHYSYDGTSWTSESTLPYNFYQGSAVVYNNKIHILGGGNSSSTYTKHYYYNGTNWVEKSTLPFNFCMGSAVVFNNKIHILGSYNTGNYTKHYSYNGTNWTEESTLPYDFYGGSAVVFNNKIHILGNYVYSNTTRHYSYDGTSWTSESTLPYNFGLGSAVVFNNKIHILGSNVNATKHYSLDGAYIETSDGSHAEGIGTVATGDAKHVQGKYNVNKYNTLFEIGNGTADNARSNALEVYEDGNVALNNGSSDKYVFHIGNTAASTAVAYCNKVTKFYAENRAEASQEFTFSVTIKCGDGLNGLAFDNTPTITSISLYDAATSKQTVASANFTYTAEVNSNQEIVLTFTIADAFITATVATALNAVIDSKSPGFACVYAANDLNLTGIIQGRGIVDQFNGFADAFNILPVPHTTQHVGDFYFPTGGPRWNLEIEVDPGTAYYAVCYLENTTTGAYFNHSVCYAGVGTPTIAAPTVAPAPVAGKVVAFVGTTWTPFVAGVAGVVTDGIVTTKPRLRIQGYHANNTPTAGLGMHLRLFRIY